MALFFPFPCLRRPLAGEAGRHSAVPFAFSGRQAPPARPPLRSARPDVPRRPPPARPPSGVGGPASPVPPGLGPRPLRGRSVLRFAPPGAPGLPAVASRPPAPPIRFVCNILCMCRFFANFAANNQCLIYLLRFLFWRRKKTGIPGIFYRHLKMKIRHLQKMQMIWELYVTKLFPKGIR